MTLTTRAQPLLRLPPACMPPPPRGYSSPLPRHISSAAPTENCSSQQDHPSQHAPSKIIHPRTRTRARAVAKAPLEEGSNQGRQGQAGNSLGRWRSLLQVEQTSRRLQQLMPQQSPTHLHSLRRGPQGVLMRRYRPTISSVKVCRVSGAIRDPLRHRLAAGDACQQGRFGRLHPWRLRVL